MRGKGRGRARRRTQVGERREPAREERGSQLGISKADLLEHAPVHPRAPEVGKLRRRLRDSRQVSASPSQTGSPTDSSRRAGRTWTTPLKMMTKEKKVLKRTEAAMALGENEATAARGSERGELTVQSARSVREDAPWAKVG